jgi:hypothetical protein
VAKAAKMADLLGAELGHKRDIEKPERQAV